MKKKTNHDIKESLNWEQLANALAEPILIVSASGKILYANHKACELFGRSKDELIDEYFTQPISLKHADEMEIIRPDKTVVLTEAQTREGVWLTKKAWVITLHDITQHRKIEESLRISSNVFKFSKEGIIITDASATIIDVNEEFINTTGYLKKEALGRNPKFLHSGRHDASFYREMWTAIEEKGYWRGEIWNRRKNGNIYPETMTISSVKNEIGDVTHYIGIFFDISERVHQQEKLEAIAHYDSLTGLPNRLLLTDRLQMAMSQTKRHGNKLALIFMDIDNFKEINDKYGHKTGDQFLYGFANTFLNTLRDSDTISRFGGDEFVLLLPDLHLYKNFSDFLNRLLEIANRTQHIDDLSLKATISLGVTIYPQEENVTGDQLLREADQAMYQAMYQAKIQGKNRFVLFDPEIDKKLKEHNHYVMEIKQALEQKKFTLYYQPKVNMRTGEILGAEALIRWEHPEKGLIFPNDFLPFIEFDPFTVVLENG